MRYYRYNFCKESYALVLQESNDLKTWKNCKESPTGDFVLSQSAEDKMVYFIKYPYASNNSYDENYKANKKSSKLLEQSKARDDRYQSQVEKFMKQMDGRK